MSNMGNTARCNECKALVFAFDIASEETGNCLRCEVKRLKHADVVLKSHQETNRMLLEEIAVLKKNFQALRQKLEESES